MEDSVDIVDLFVNAYFTLTLEYLTLTLDDFILSYARIFPDDFTV